MSFDLMIVESPSKAKTIQRYVGDQYKVLASYGHVRDLVAKKGSVIVQDDSIEMKYDDLQKSKEHVQLLCAQAKKARKILLATDPDREGEAIAYHVLEILKQQKALEGKVVSRVVFYEITKEKILEALEHARDLDLNLVNAQQARRALDYLVGFHLSPVLWVKVRPKTSAGRVQSSALDLLSRNQRAIENFQSQEYWTIHGTLIEKKDTIDIKLVATADKKLEQFSLTNEQATQDLIQKIHQESDFQAQIDDIETKKRKRQPAPPFTTSTLQQEAARKLNFSTTQTMRVAQQLYEGIDMNGQFQALLTYIRTDSVSLSDTAINDIRALIKTSFGSDALPSKGRSYKTKTKNAQEAHEAIRPIDCFKRPETLRSFLTPEQYKLYQLIWARTVSSQMVDALYDDHILKLRANNGHIFESRRSELVQEGFLALYQEGQDNEEESDYKKPKKTSGFTLQKGALVRFNPLQGKQHFTEPPARYSEASLVKALESYGIGRPSTYSSIISTLKAREYVELKQKRFYVTEIGLVVNDFLVKFFAEYVNPEFTAKMEDLLDDIAIGQQSWVNVVKNFWDPFHKLVDHISKNISKKEAVDEKTDLLCPKCESPVVKKLGKAGRFLGCSAYPDCDYTASLDGEQPAPVQKIDRDCPECQSPLVQRRGRFGLFIGCSAYPTCRYIEAADKPKATSVSCPTCKEGVILQKKSRRGTYFYACSRYPSCTQTYSAMPVEKACPQCYSPVLMEKETKRYGKQHVCPNKECGYKVSVE